jgi:uncharacterized protein YukE
MTSSSVSTGFHVDETVLDTFAQRLDLLVGDLPAARDYTSRYIETDWTDTGLLIGINPTIDDLRRSVLRVLTELEKVTTDSSVKIRATAKAYRAADDATDRRLRGLDEIPEGEEPFAPNPRCPAPGQPPDWHVNDTLVDPRSPHPMPRLAQEMLSFQDKVSIAWALNWLIDEICGVNPFEEAAAWVSGDFEQFTRAADAITHLSEFFSAYAHTVDDAQWDLSKGWSGEAADVAQSYFATVTTALKDLRPQLHDAGKALEEVAVTVYYLGQSVQGGLQLFSGLGHRGRYLRRSGSCHLVDRSRWSRRSGGDMTSPSDPLAGFAPDNPGLARLVRTQLRALARSDDSRFRRIATDILSGKRDIYDLPEEGFSQALDSTTQQLNSLDDEQRQELIRQGQQFKDENTE